MPHPPKPETKGARQTARRAPKLGEALIKAVEDRAEGVAGEVEALVEKLAPYPLQGG